MLDPAAVVSLAIIAAAVAVVAVLIGMAAAVAMAARECALRLRLRRIDTRAARALDVRSMQTLENRGRFTTAQKEN